MLRITATTMYRPLGSVLATGHYVRHDCYFDPWTRLHLLILIDKKTFLCCMNFEPQKLDSSSKILNVKNIGTKKLLWLLNIVRVHASDQHRQEE